MTCFPVARTKSPYVDQEREHNSATHFWMAKIGGKQVRNVLRPALVIRVGLPAFYTASVK